MQLRKKLAIGVAVTASLAVGTAAFAFFTTSGSGTGRGRVVASAGLVVTSAALDSALGPDGAGASLKIHIKNGNNAELRSGAVSATAKVLDGTTELSCGITVGDDVDTSHIFGANTPDTVVALQVTMVDLPNIDQTPCLDHPIDFVVTVAAPPSGT